MNDAFEPAVPWGCKRPTGLTKALLRLCHALPGHRRINYRLIKALRAPVRAGAPAALDVRIGGLRLRLLTRGNYCESTYLFAPQFFDVEELRWIREGLAGGGVFLDVGANIGLYGLIVGAARGSAVRVFAVEPDPELRARLSFNAAQNDIAVQTAPVALSNYEGTGAIAVMHEQRGQNRLADDPAENGIPVRVTSLPSLCAELRVTAIQVLKIDVEGHEHRILADFFDRADRSLWPRLIVIEHVHDRDGAIPMLVGRFGYALVGRSRRNALLRSSPARSTAVAELQ